MGAEKRWTMNKHKACFGWMLDADKFRTFLQKEPAISFDPSMDFTDFVKTLRTHPLFDRMVGQLEFEVVAVRYYSEIRYYYAEVCDDLSPIGIRECADLWMRSGYSELCEFVQKMGGGDESYFEMIVGEILRH